MSKDIVPEEVDQVEGTDKTDVLPVYLDTKSAGNKGADRIS